MKPLMRQNCTRPFLSRPRFRVDVRISFALAAQFLPGQASFRVTSTTVRWVGAPVTFLIVSIAVRSGVVCSTAFPESVVAVPKCSFDSRDRSAWGQMRHCGGPQTWQQ
jgi:hypothetical protein